MIRPGWSTGLPKATAMFPKLRSFITAYDLPFAPTTSRTTPPTTARRIHLRSLRRVFAFVVFFGPVSMTAARL